MPRKPTYSELQQRVKELEKEAAKRKWAEEALKESEEKYRTILDSIEEAYFEVDIAGNFTFFNDSLSKILGHTRAELLGMNNRDHMTPESSKKTHNLFSQIYGTGKPIKKVNYEIIRKDGSHGFHELSASLMRDQAGQPIGFRGIARDITEQKLAEEQKKRLETQLQQAQRMEAIGTLAGGIAHDLNNTLYPIIKETLSKALEANDAALVEQKAHSLKGAAANIGAGLMRDEASQMEVASREGDLNKAHTLYPQLEHEFERALTASSDLGC